MKRILVLLCVIFFAGACEPEAPNPRFDIKSSEVEFWTERQDALTIQLDASASVRLENLMAQNLRKEMDFYVGDDKVATFMVRAPVPSGNLTFTMDDEIRARAAGRLPPDRRKD